MKYEIVPLNTEKYHTEDVEAKNPQQAINKYLKRNDAKQTRWDKWVVQFDLGGYLFGVMRSDGKPLKGK